ncbi:MAG: sigma-70 family RNA polymerase sigma factor [bacterium]|nr:sigma-70 family RNA polymerase sigma factor [bacterium]
MPDLESILSDSIWVEELALGLVGDPATAADLSQEALVASLRKGPRVARPYLAATVRNLALRWKRDASRRDALRRGHGREIETSLPSTDDMVAQAELRRVVSEEAERLEEPYRTAVFLRYFKGLTCAEIAQRLDLPAGTVRSRVTRALERLRERLDERAGGREAWSAVALSLLPPAPPAGHLPILEGVLTMKALQVGTAAALAGIAALGAWTITRDADPEQPELVRRDEAPPTVLESSPEKIATADPVREPDARTPLAAASASPAAAPAANVPQPDAAALARVALVAVDANDQPLAGAAVRYAAAGRRPQEGAQWSERVERTGADGSARFEIELEAQRKMLDFEVSYAGLARHYVRTHLVADTETHLGRVVLGAAGRIRGRVQEPSGHPVAGARVFVTPPEGEWDDSERTARHGPTLEGSVAETVTGIDGSYELDGVSAGFVRVWAHAAGFLYTQTEPLELVSASSIEGANLTLAHERTSDRIAGVVLSPTGEPVETSLGYRWIFGNSATSSSIQTDEEGRFSLLLDKRVPVTFHVYDYENRWSDFVRPSIPPGSTDVVFQFEKSSELEVVVRSRDEPVLHFRASAISEPERIDGMHIGSLARARMADYVDGRAPLVVPTRPFRVRVEAPGYEALTLGPFEPEGAPAELDFELVPLPGVVGRVVADGGPVSGARIALREWTDEHSLYVNSGYRFRLDSSDRDTSMRTDASGNFRVDFERAGRYSLRVLAEGWAVCELGPLDLEPRTGAQDLVVELSHGGVIEGRVLVDANLSPAGTIVAINDGAATPRTVRVAEDGRYRFESLTPGSWQVLEAEAEYDPSTSFSSYSSDPGGPIEWDVAVIEGAASAFDLDLRSKDEAFLAGSLHVGGVPAKGWTVSVEGKASEGAEATAIQTVIDAHGTFHLGPLAVGPAELVLRAPQDQGGLELLDDALELAIGDNAWNVELPVASATGGGAPTGADAQVLVEYRWFGSASGRTLKASIPIVADAAGAFTLPLVPLGRGEVRTWSPLGPAPHGAWKTLAGFEIASGANVISLD